MLKLSSMADPEARLNPLMFLRDLDSKTIDISQEIKGRMERGLSYENVIREMLDEVKNSSDFNKNFLIEENVEILVKE